MQNPNIYTYKYLPLADGEIPSSIPARVADPNWTITVDKSKERSTVKLRNSIDPHNPRNASNIVIRGASLQLVTEKYYTLVDPSKYNLPDTFVYIDHDNLMPIDGMYKIPVTEKISVFKEDFIEILPSSVDEQGNQLPLTTMATLRATPVYRIVTPGHARHGIQDQMDNPDWRWIDYRHQMENSNNSINLNTDWTVAKQDLELAIGKRVPQPLWSETITVNYDLRKEYLCEELRTRYAMVTHADLYVENQIIDTYVPYLMYKQDMHVEQLRNVGLPKSAVTISPWFSSMLGIPQIPAEQLCKLLGYNKTSLRKLLTDVKKRNLAMIFVGYGGTGVNTLHWLAEICKLTGIFEIFQTVAVYEPEKLEISNLLRYPKDPTKVVDTNTTNKTSLLTDELSCLTVSNYYAVITDRYRPAPVEKHTIVYGAPSIATRERLSLFGNFISATHGDTDCSLHLNPLQNTDLQVESYGIIQLSNFFMNQLRLAIGLLEVLSDTSIKLNEKDKVLLDYSFDANTVSGADRKYKFPPPYTGGLLPQGA